jgi:hypothetical protein
MELTETTQAKSDQQNYSDYIGVEKTVTVSEVRKGSPEQPIEIHLVEYPGKPFKPSKTVRRLLVAAWGKDSDKYVGRRMTLYGDPTVKWAGQAVGGIRLRALSHLTKPVTLALAESRGHLKTHVVQPLAEAPTRDWLAELEQARGDVDLLGGLGVAAKQAGADGDTLAAIRAAYQEAKASNG